MATCEEALAEAQNRYVTQDFETTEALVRPCLDRPNLAESTRIGLYRLLTLVSIQRSDLPEARRTVLRLLSAVPDYAPDPVQDPPAYVAIVSVVREQLGLEGIAPPVADARRSQPRRAIGPRRTSLREEGDLSIRLGIGAGSYGGERGRAPSSRLGEFVENGGPSFTVGAAYRYEARISVALEYRAARFATLLENDVLPTDVQVDPDESSSWVNFLTLSALRAFSADRAAPYVRLGVTASAGLINGTWHAGIGPLLGFGVDVAITPTLGAFAEMSATSIYPGDAVDRVDTNSGFGDVLTFLGVGVRVRAASGARSR